MSVQLCVTVTISRRQITHGGVNGTGTPFIFVNVKIKTVRKLTTVL